MADEQPPAQSAAEGEPQEKAGDDARAVHQEELRGARFEALSALGDLGSLTSAVIIAGDKLTFEGAVTGSNTTRDQGSTVLTPISTRTITAVRTVHVPPGGYDDLAAVAQRKALVLLRSQPRWGSTTTAIHLLAQWSTVHQVRFAGTLDALPIEELPKRSGFLLEGLTPGQLVELRVQDLEALEDRLLQRDTQLVVIVDAAARIPDHAVARMCVTLSAPPVVRDLVASHLVELLGSQTKVDQFLAEHRLTETLSQIDVDRFDARQVAELARDLAEVADGQGGFEDAVSRFQERSKLDVEMWFEDIKDFGERSMVISLAVLNGMSFNAVTRAAALLEDILREQTGGRDRQTRSRQSRSARLKAARARLSTELRRTRYGLAELEIVSFADRSYPQRLLHYLWHEQDYDRVALLAWLHSLGEDVETAVRIRAAAAIGYLAQFDFDTLRRSVISPWASSGNADHRERAAAALAIPARHPQTAIRVLRMVLEWASEGGKSLRLAAARALGTSVGVLLPDGPDEPLAALAEDCTVALALAIGDSMAELIHDAEPERRLQLLLLLEKWSLEPRSGRQRAGVLGFLEVANSVWVPVSTPDGEVYWPMILRMAAEGAIEPGEPATIRQTIIRLWGNALVAPGSDHSVRSVLRNWAAAAQRSPELRPAMVGLLAAAATTPRQARILSFHAKSWNDRYPLAPDFAAKLLDALSRKGTP